MRTLRMENRSGVAKRHSCNVVSWLQRVGSLKVFCRRRSSRPFSKLAGPRETRTGSMTGNVVSRRIGDVRYGIYTPFRLVMQWVSRGFLQKVGQ